MNVHDLGKTFHFDAARLTEARALTGYDIASPPDSGVAAGPAPIDSYVDDDGPARTGGDLATSPPPDVDMIDLSERADWRRELYKRATIEKPLLQRPKDTLPTAWPIYEDRYWNHGRHMLVVEDGMIIDHAKVLEMQNISIRDGVLPYGVIDITIEELLAPMSMTFGNFFLSMDAQGLIYPTDEFSSKLKEGIPPQGVLEKIMARLGSYQQDRSYKKYVEDTKGKKDTFEYIWALGHLAHAFGKKYHLHLRLSRDSCPAIVDEPLLRMRLLSDNPGIRLIVHDSGAISSYADASILGIAAEDIVPLKYHPKKTRIYLDELVRDLPVAGLIKDQDRVGVIERVRKQKYPEEALCQMMATLAQASATELASLIAGQRTLLETIEDIGRRQDKERKYREILKGNAVIILKEGEDYNKQLWNIEGFVKDGDRTHPYFYAGTVASGLSEYPKEITEDFVDALINNCVQHLKKLLGAEHAAKVDAARERHAINDEIKHVLSQSTLEPILPNSDFEKNGENIIKIIFEYTRIVINHFSEIAKEFGVTFADGKAFKVVVVIDDAYGAFDILEYPGDIIQSANGKNSDLQYIIVRKNDLPEEWNYAGSDFKIFSLP